MGNAPGDDLDRMTITEVLRIVEFLGIDPMQSRADLIAAIRAAG